MWRRGQGCMLVPRYWGRVVNHGRCGRTSNYKLRSVMTINWAIDAGSIVAALIALGALWLAWMRLSAMLLQVRANTLLALDHRWESEHLLSIKADVQQMIDQVKQDTEAKYSHLSVGGKLKKSAETYAMKLQMMRTNDPTRYMRFFEICGFFETMGYVAKGEYIPVEDVVNLFGGSILKMGIVFKPHIDKLLGEEGADLRMYECFLWLLGETKRISGYSVDF